MPQEHKTAINLLVTKQSTVIYVNIRKLEKFITSSVHEDSTCIET